MLKSLFLILCLIVGIYFANSFAGDNGYVLINTTDNVYKLSIVSFVIAWVMILLVLYLIQAIISKLLQWNTASFNYFANRKHKKAQKRQNQAFQAFNDGDQHKAHRLLGKNANNADNPLFNLLYAFDMAYKSGDYNDAEKYLEQAKSIDGGDTFAVKMANLQMQMVQQKWSSAQLLLQQMLQDNPKNPQLLQYAVLVFSQQKDYASLNTWLENIAKANILSPDALNKLTLEILDNLMMQEPDAKQILKLWKEQPRVTQNNPQACLLLIKNLLDKNASEEAYGLIVDLAKSENMPSELHNQIPRLQVKDSGKLCKILLNQANSAGDPNLFWRDVAYLYAKAGDFKLAEEYFDKFLANREPLSNDALLASFIYEQNQHFLKAGDVKKQAIKNYLNLV